MTLTQCYIISSLQYMCHVAGQQYVIHEKTELLNLAEKAGKRNRKQMVNLIRLCSEIISNFQLDPFQKTKQLPPQKGHRYYESSFQEVVFPACAVCVLAYLTLTRILKSMVERNIETLQKVQVYGLAHQLQIKARPKNEKSFKEPRTFLAMSILLCQTSQKEVVFLLQLKLRLAYS